MSKISVTTIAGLTSGGDANKVKIESGDTLEASTIGTASGAMSIKPAGTEVVNIGTTGDILVKGTTNQRAALILRAGSNTANSQLQLGDQASDFVGRIMYDHSDDTMRFQTNGSERARISAAGIHIGGTGAANALDDYEEGTWTATLGGTGSAPTVSSYSYNSGHYTKIGRQVFAHIYIRVENGDISGGSGDITIEGLPFASKSTGNISNGAGAWIENYTNVVNNFSSGRNYARPVMVAGENRMRVYQLSFTDPTQATGWSIGQADNGAFLIGGVMVYMTA